MATLNALKGGNLTPEEVSSKTGQPLFRVRSGLRELNNAGFVDEDGEKYVLTQNGKSVIS
jgi:predicted transcriptional regulator